MIWLGDSEARLPFRGRLEDDDDCERLFEASQALVDAATGRQPS